MEETGPGLVLYDTTGRRIGRFGGVYNGAGLSLQSIEGEARLSLVSQPEGPHLLLFDARENSGLNWEQAREGPTCCFMTAMEARVRLWPWTTNNPDFNSRIAKGSQRSWAATRWLLE